MSKKDAFNGAKTTLVDFYVYFNTVAQDIGLERALSLVKKMAEDRGAMIGKMIKEQAGNKTFDAKTASQIMEEAAKNTLGIPGKTVEETPKRVIFRVIKCPYYEAAKMAGMDAKAIETMCQAKNIRFDDVMFKQLNPNLSFRMRKFRLTPDDFCEEEIILE
jgi:hypothetical protein